MATTNPLDDANNNIATAEKRIMAIDAEIEKLAAERGQLENNIRQDRLLVKVLDAYGRGELEKMMGAADGGGQINGGRQPRGGSSSAAKAAGGKMTREETARLRDAAKAILEEAGEPMMPAALRKALAANGVTYEGSANAFSQLFTKHKDFTSEAGRGIYTVV